jgi:hypothetical protein
MKTLEANKVGVMVTYFSPNLPPAGANVIMITIFSDFDKFS